MNRFPPLYCIDPLTDLRWESLLENHARASVFHSISWLNALLQTYHFEPVAYTSAAKQEELTNGLLFARVKSWLTGHRLVSLPFSDHCEPLVNGFPEFQQLLAAPQDELKDGTWKYIELRPKTALYVQDLEPHPEQYIFHQLDLRPELDCLHRNLHVDSIRRRIQRAEREGLTLESGNNERLLADFYKLHLATRRRHSLPPQPRKWFRNLLDCFLERAIIRVARRHDMAIAAVLTLESRNSLVYKYGCSDAQYHNTGAMPFVFWDMIRDAKQRGFEQIDLGRTELNNTGLIRFKEHWGATPLPLIYGRYPPRKARMSLREQGVTRMAKRAFAYCPDWLLTTAGGLLYPHIG